MLKEFTALLKKEIVLELRGKYALGGLLLYVISTVFVVYLSVTKVTTIPVWNALFWIIFLFAATNAVAKAFVQDGKEQLLYLYTLASPQAVILAKIAYNTMLLTVVSLLTFVIYSVLIGNPVENTGLYLLTLVLGAAGFSGTLTLLSSIAAQTGNNVTLLSILGFPILLPMLITLLKLSKNAADGLAFSVSEKYLLVLLALNVIVAALSYILFPYLWRD